MTSHDLEKVKIISDNGCGPPLDLVLHDCTRRTPPADSTAKKTTADTKTKWRTIFCKNVQTFLTTQYQHPWPMESKETIFTTFVCLCLWIMIWVWECHSIFGWFGYCEAKHICWWGTAALDSPGECKPSAPRGSAGGLQSCTPYKDTWETTWR